MLDRRAVRILVADDHIVVRHGLVSILQTQPDLHVVAEAVGGEQAIELYRQHRPDVALLDLRMPRVDGAAAMKTIRAEFRDARFLVLTTYRRDEDIYRALCAGALGYVLKSAGGDELIAAIRSVAEGRRYIPPDIAARMVERLPILELSGREQDVLRLLCRGLANKEIASHLGIADHTVRNHTTNILDKLGAKDRTQAVVYAIERGLVEVDTSE